MGLLAARRVAAAGIALAAALAAGALAKPGADPQPDFDLILRGGTIYTGEAQPYIGDVAIRGDRIVYTGPKAAGR
ncbi:MAG: hypothetical protein O9272_09710, partial [Brevundimonas sp.]|nr:hypothetical protein [Brevundimonas sp.]